MDNLQLEQIINNSVARDLRVESLPMVALRGKVVLPNISTAFDVGRLKSLNAINLATEDDRQLIFVASQKDQKDTDPTIDQIYNIGVVCAITHLTKTQQESFRVNIDALYTAKIVNYVQTEGTFVVNIVKLKTIVDDEIECEASLRITKMALKKYTALNTKLNREMFNYIDTLENPDEFANASTYNLPFKEYEKQEVLEITNLKDKVLKVYQLINKQLTILSTEKIIQDKVRQSVEKNQKEFYLREQLKAIHNELGDDESEKQILEEQIKAKAMPEFVREKALKELSRMSKMNQSSPDYSVLRTYIDWILDLPFDVETKDRESLKDAIDILEADHYGLDKVKKRIIEYLAVLKLTKKVGGSIICLVGPPGVGKTSIGKSIAHALDRNFVRMSLGGVKDEAEIRGHRKTYVGAIPGRLMYAIKDAKSSNPVILLDEIDKMSSDMRGDPASAMLEVLDPEQNCNFRDRYLEVEYDLSKVLFVTTANSLSTIPAPLLDRMEIIELGSYTLLEKIQIAKKYLVPKEIEKNGLSDKNIEFDSDSIEKIITGYTLEAGVRRLERTIGSVCRKVAVKFAENERSRKVKITADNLSDYLNAPKFTDDDKDRPSEVGVSQGLAFTTVGGTTLTIETALATGKGNIQITGKLGDVMQESAKIALSYIKVNAEKYGIDPSVFEKTDVFIHVPEGATPKDGPSAGITLATSILSAFTNKKVSSKVSMTGELTLTGKVLPIGGLKEKALASFRLGICDIIIPKANQKDLEEIPKEIINKLNFMPVSNAEQVFKIAIEGLL